MSCYNISYSDVLRHKDATEETLTNREQLNKILYDMGMEVNRGYEGLYCKHRSPITDNVVTGRYYLGMERTDDAWKDIKYKVNLLERYGHTEGYLLDA